MTLVLDGSATLAWCFEDECTEAIRELFLRIAARGALVPAIWHLEVANGFRSAIRRRRVGMERRDLMLAALKDLPVRVDGETPSRAWRRTLQLSDRFDLTPYDASYLELALRSRMPLATLDRKLSTSASEAGIRLALS